MNRRIIALLSLNFFMLLSWKLLDPFLPDEKIDLFLFYDLEQSPNWYVFYTSQYLNIIIFSYIIHILVSRLYPELKALTTFLLIIGIFRLILYWLYRGSISLDVPVACVFIYSVILFFKVRKWQS